MSKMSNLEIMPASDTTGPPSVISIGLWRMGTVSMAAAYNKLGLRAHHAINSNKEPEQWALFEKAADATWQPGSGGAPSTTAPFTTEQWNELYGRYDALTEISSAFAEQLINTYPNAKIVIVRRDFKKWWPSVRSGVIEPLFNYQALFLLWVVLPILNNRGVAAMRKIVCGFFKTNNPYVLTEEEAFKIYEDYFKHIEEIVPEDRRLVYQLGSGWEPLCEFLGKDVPDGEFPRMNEADALKASQQAEIDRMNRDAKAKLWSWVPFTGA